MSKLLEMENSFEYDLKLTSEDIALIVNNIVKLPYQESAITIEKIVSQVNEQNKDKKS